MWVGSPALGIGEGTLFGKGTLFKGVVAMGSFLTSSCISFSILNKSPSSTTGARHSQSSCTTAQNTSGGSGPNGAPLEYNGQCDSFLPLHLLVILGYAGVFGPKGLLSSQHCEVG